jgi:uncharacterized protein (TIGR00255 family)
MTGFGRGSCEVGQRRLVVELRSLNHRFLEVKLRLPWAEPALEILIQQHLRQKLDRGIVTVGVREEGGGTPQAVRVDLALARGYWQAIEELREHLGVAEPPTLALLVAQPGVIAVGEGPLDAEGLWQALRPGLDQAVAALVAERAREGAVLASDLRARLDAVDALRARVAGLAAETPEQHRQRLRERLDKVLGVLEPGINVDPQRLAVEVAILAEKADVAEELTRMGAHLGELRRLLGEAGPVGRRLEFLIQELNREVNTIGSKLQSTTASSLVIEMKAEIERLREQIQNVE